MKVQWSFSFVYRHLKYPSRHWINVIALGVSTLIQSCPFHFGERPLPVVNIRRWPPALLCPSSRPHSIARSPCRGWAPLPSLQLTSLPLPATKAWGCGCWPASNETAHLYPAWFARVSDRPSWRHFLALGFSRALLGWAGKVLESSAVTDFSAIPTPFLFCFSRIAQNFWCAHLSCFPEWLHFHWIQSFISFMRIWEAGKAATWATVTTPTYVSSLLHGPLLLDKIPSVESDRHKPVLGGKGRGGRRRCMYSRHSWIWRFEHCLLISVFPFSLPPVFILHMATGWLLAAPSLYQHHRSRSRSQRETLSLAASVFHIPLGNSGCPVLGHVTHPESPRPGRWILCSCSQLWAVFGGWESWRRVNPIQIHKMGSPVVIMSSESRKRGTGCWTNSHL